MGYHKTEIPRGEYGKFSKVKEEFLELQDAVQQDNKILIGVELSDLLGAIEGFAASHGFTLGDLLKMKDLTQSAFLDGTRTPRETVIKDPIGGGAIHYGGRGAHSIRG